MGRYFAACRGFHLQKSLHALTPIVRIIDDWNRNLPLALMLEAKVGQGRLLLVSADLSGDFKDRPAAYCLRQSLLRYAHSTSFAPQMDIRIEDVEESLFPVLRMQTLVGENAKDNSLIVENPQISAVYEEEQFPIEIEIPLCLRQLLQRDFVCAGSAGEEKGRISQRCGSVYKGEG